MIEKTGSIPIIIGVAGGTGSGKTTLVDAIIKNIAHRDLLVIPHDSYYKDRSHLSAEQRAQINYDHPDALDTDLLVSQLKELRAGRNIVLPAYDFKNHIRVEKGISVSPTDVVVVEGILILAEPDLREMMDVKIFVDTDDDIRFIRRLKRDMDERGRSLESVIEQYIETVRQMHIEFVEPSRRYADVIIPEGHNPVAVDMVVSMVKHKLKIPGELNGK